MKTHSLQLAIACFVFLAINAPATVLYVDLNSTNPTPPYTNWSTAATTIQDAVDAATNGDEVLVANGVYQTGGRVGYGSLTNRVAVTKPLTVRSVNGPAVTVIQGYQVFSTTNGDGAIRCVYLTNGVALVGFTLTNGATRSAGDSSREQSGGGVWCESASAVVFNCVLAGNSASCYGGGACQGTLNNCILSTNSATGGRGGGACFSTLNNCTLIGNLADELGGGACYSTLSNCMLCGNSVYEGCGGGTYDSTLNNCTLNGNMATAGGGAGCSTLNNCALTGNSAWNGGGAYLSTLNNCTLTGNAAGNGGGAYVSTLNNCIVYYNTAPNDANCLISDLNYCCTMPLPDGGTGNITDEPQLTDFSHISAGSPCRSAGSAAYTSGVDIDGEAWANPPSIGCDEYHSGSITGLLSVAIMADNTNVAKGYAVNFEGLITGQANTNVWDFKDGTLVTNLPYASHNWSTTGDYAVKFTAYNESNPGGVSATQMVHVAEGIYYVTLTSTNPVPPFGSWNTAATNIQAAVDVAFVGGTVLVSNGFYRTGVRDVAGVTNRVTVLTPYLTVASANGPAVTLIDGSDLVRCVYLTNNVVLSGFTLTNGNVPGSGNGGGVYCESTSVTITNCVLIDNNAGTGGGAEGGTLNNCTLTGNSAANVGGGADSSILNNCDLRGNWVGGISVAASIKGSKQSGPTPKMLLVNLGGGAANSTLNNCTLIGNQAYNDGDLYADAGGGADSSTLNNCIVMDNGADFGGGVEESTLNNCTLTGNSAGNNFGGADSSTLNNCIVYYNTNGDYFNSSLNYCCTAQPPDNGIGNITNEPAFVDLAGGDFHLQPNSPCINAGNNAYVSVTNDLDGNPRIQGGTVDIGAYEYQTPSSVISYAWLQQYGLTNDGSADYADTDGDGFNNWNEWRAGTNPTDPSSLLKMTTVTNDVSGITVTWQSVSGVTYFLQRSTDLGAQPAFSTIQTDIAGQPDTTSYTDTDATGAGPYFYRVGVQ